MGHQQAVGRARLAGRRSWLALGLALALAAGPAAAANKSKFSAYQAGKPVIGLPCDTVPVRTAVLMGGGSDVKAAYSWMIDKIDQCGSGKLGNFVVIRAGGNPDYDRFIYKLGPVASVQTLVIPTREVADDPVLDEYIQNAAAIWMTGGDQADYYNNWKGTRLERLVHAQVKTHGIPIGGTSAGMMMLSEFNYLADPYTITSAEALLDPYKADSSKLARDFWLENDPLDEATPFAPLRFTITDSHFRARDRMGRLIAFFGRVIADGWTTPGDARAIGVDPETALLLEYDEAMPRLPAVPTVVTNPGTFGAAYVLSVGKNAVINVVPLAFTFTNIQVTRFTPGQATSYQLNVNDGVLTSVNNNGSLY